LSPHLPTADAVLLGPGDDAAVIAFPDGRTAASTDILVEGVHFRLDWSSGFDVGWRLAAQNLADAAAMGARPIALLVALAGPPALLGGSWGQEFARGAGLCCEASGTSVAGGDLSAAATVTACGTVLADLEGRRPVTRAGARPGDVLALTDAVALEVGLGGSAAGLAFLTAHGPAGLATADAAAAAAVAAYLRPDPPIGQGVTAARAGAVAMLDVSDGLLLDAGRLAVASGVRLTIDARSEALVRAADSLAPVARPLGSDPWEWVLSGGEDHALLAAFPAEAGLPEGWDGIGHVEEVGTAGAGAEVSGAPSGGGRSVGWDHFARGGEPER
jgi:thiamine-monophosphate kinase